MADPLMAPNDIVQVTLAGQLDLQVCETVLHYRARPDFVSQPLFLAYTDLFDQLSPAGTGMIDKYLACMSSDYTLHRVLIQVIFPIRYKFSQELVTPKPGTIDEAALPPGNSAAITKEGELANRHGVGGVRMPGMPISFNDAGFLTNGAILKLGEFAATLNDPKTLDAGGTLDPIIFNRAAPNDSQKLVSLQLQTNIRTMSRRVLGRGI